MLRRTAVAVLGLMTMAMPVMSARGQVAAAPCFAFQVQDGRWVAMRQVTVTGQIGPVELMPGQPAGVDVARSLNDQCR